MPFKVILFPEIAEKFRQPLAASDRKMIFCRMNLLVNKWE
jgi:hypothetical protein